MKHYTESQKQFEKALLVRKTLQNDNITYAKDLKDREIALKFVEKYSDNEIKFRIAKCMVENFQYKEANTILSSVPPKNRSPKINMLYSKVIQESSGMDKNIITAYKEVLKKCPLAFECIDGLLAMNVRGSEVNSLIIHIQSETYSFEWMNKYIRGLSEMSNRKYPEAIMSLASIDHMKSNPKILALIGESFYYSGDYERAYNYLKKSYDLYPFMKQGMQKYALLCDVFKKNRELEQIVKPSSMHPYEYSSDNWFVFATYLYSCSKYEKAQYFINRVINQYQQKNVDALLLNAKILHGSKKSNEALVSLRQALKYEPYRFEVHRWISEILIATDRGRDAQNQAIKSLKLLGETPRTLTLTASTFLKNPISKDKAKSYLQKALELNEFYAKAVFLLVQILVDDKDTKAAIKLLEKTVAFVPNIKISLILADLYAKNKNLSSAIEMYTKVLNLDSSNKHALSGLMALGSATSSTLESTEDDTDTVENTSRNKADESDELVWSDVDMMD
jgi:anaphase-promoting complex subunit 7